jgi:hypothetical protein
MSDTPETEIEANSATLCDQCVPADFARRLERERDEARRDSAAERNRSARELSCMSAMLFEAESERDNLRQVIVAFCEDHKWAATDWKNQARVKPLFDIEKTYKTTNE